MPRYIDADKILKFSIRADHCDKENADPHFINGIETVMEYVEYLVDEEPVDAAEVVRAKIANIIVPKARKKGNAVCSDLASRMSFAAEGEAE